MTAAVALTALALTDFRNYGALQIGLGSPLIILTGPNGAGKTNLLEAVSLLTPGRGLRRAAYGEMTRIGAAGGWAVAARIGREGEETRLGTGITSVGENDGSRKVRVNGAPAPSADALLEHLRILWLTPAMDGLFTGPAGDRRRFLDRLVLTVDPEHGRRVRDFERLLTSRNRLLEDGGSAEWLDAVETQLAAVSVAVSLARGETVALLSAQMDMDPDTSAFPAGRLTLAGEFDREIANRPAAEAEFQFRETLRRTRARDRAARRTLDGPHRSDLHVVYSAKDMPAAFCSTGEQKALLISLILAHADLVAAVSGLPPILLLDEIAAHLDSGRRAALFERLRALGGQSFMTGTEPELFASAGADAERLEVCDGTVRAGA